MPQPKKPESSALQEGQAVIDAAFVAAAEHNLNHNEDKRFKNTTQYHFQKVGERYQVIADNKKLPYYLSIAQVRDVANGRSVVLHANNTNKRLQLNVLKKITISPTVEILNRQQASLDDTKSHVVDLVAKYTFQKCNQVIKDAFVGQLKDMLNKACDPTYPHRKEAQVNLINTLKKIDPASKEMALSNIYDSKNKDRIMSLVGINPTNEQMRVMREQMMREREALKAHSTAAPAPSPFQRKK